MNLETFKSRFDRGRPAAVEALWIAVQALLFSTSLPGSAWRRALLRLFGARIGKRVVIKPRARVKFPWRLRVGDFSWIGEGCWIDNLETVSIGSNCCVSQGAYLCTGNHDWSSVSFDLKAEPITIGDGVWVAAFAAVAPGTRIGEGAVISMGSVAAGDLDPWTVYRGNPAAPSGKRPR